MEHIEFSDNFGIDHFGGDGHGDGEGRGLGAWLGMDGHGDGEGDGLGFLMAAFGGFGHDGGGDDGFASAGAAEYGFTVTNGQVTAMDRVFGTLTLPEHIPSDATFAVNATTGVITETLTGSTAVESVVYTPDAGTSGVYQVTQETTTFTNPSTTTPSGATHGVSFTITGSTVTGMQEVVSFGNFSASETVSLSPLTLFSVSGNTVTESTLQGNTIETNVYTEATGSTLYAKASDASTFILPGTSTTALDVNAHDQSNFTFDASGNVTQVQAVSANGVTTTLTFPSTVTFQQVAPGFVQETMTEGTNSSFVLFYQGASSAPYTEIAHGSGSTVDLVGVKAQLAEIPTGLTALL